MIKTCFIISSIGENGTETRRIADEKYDLVFEPVLIELGYKVTRADKIGTPGLISDEIIERITNDNLVIADISDENPNVFYELAIRNAVHKPIIVFKGENQRIPFDMQDKRSIEIDMKKARLWVKGKKELKKQIEEAEKNPQKASESILSKYKFPMGWNPGSI